MRDTTRNGFSASTQGKPDPRAAPRRSAPATWPVAWATLGLSMLLLMAIYRLGQQALVAVLGPLTPLQWLALAANVIFMAYSEGYRGFQLRFSPRFAERAWSLAATGVTPWRRILAPFYAMGYFAAPRRVVIGAWLLTALVIGFVVVFRLLPQPWRGVLDAGVVVGLVWGLIATWFALLSQASLMPSRTRS